MGLKGDHTGFTAPINLLTGHASELVLLEVDAVTGQHLEAIAAGTLCQPDRIRNQNMGKLIDQGIEEIEPGSGGKCLGQLGQQGVLQQRKLLG